MSMLYTVKPVLSDHSKIDRTKSFKINFSLLKVGSIAECCFGAFYISFDLHQQLSVLKNNFWCSFGMAA